MFKRTDSSIEVGVSMDSWLDDVARELAGSIKTIAAETNPVRTGASKSRWRTEPTGSGYVVYNNTHYQSNIEILGWRYTPPYGNLYKAMVYATS